VTFAGALTQESVREMYWRASVAVNLSPPGLFDKAALESMLSGVPTIVTNPAFDPLLGDYRAMLRIAGTEDSEGLARALKNVLAISPAERQDMVDAIRQRVQASHSLDGMMDRLVALMASTQ
jgi:glycosyltransferase involved in cell wall biosynthesis